MTLKLYSPSQAADQNGRKVSTALQVFNNGLPRSKVRSIKLMCGIVTSKTHFLSNNGFISFYTFKLCSIYNIEVVYGIL